MTNEEMNKLMQDVLKQKMIDLANARYIIKRMSEVIDQIDDLTCDDQDPDTLSGKIQSAILGGKGPWGDWK